MSQRIVTLCDAHQSRDEDVPGVPYDLALRSSGEAFTFATVDLCEACAKPLVDLVAELTEVGREFVGEVKQVKRARKSTGGPPFACEVCGKDFQTAQGRGSHQTRSHPGPR